LLASTATDTDTMYLMGSETGNNTENEEGISQGDIECKRQPKDSNSERTSRFKLALSCTGGTLIRLLRALTISHDKEINWCKGLALRRSRSNHLNWLIVCLLVQERHRKLAHVRHSSCFAISNVGLHFQVPLVLLAHYPHHHRYCIRSSL
jgi:hypothetical protein